MANPFRATRQFERFLFRGVPEQPEAIWQRKPMAYVNDRTTGRSQFAEQHSYYESIEAEVIATIIYQPNLQKIKIVRETKHPEGFENQTR